jgi:hypothetical protein
MARRIWSVLLLVMSPVLLGGCALSRADQLARQSDKVESRLIQERDRTMRLSSGSPEVGERLDYLSSLRSQLTVADAARKLAPRLLTDPGQVETAYDILEEVYSTIEWNIPLSPRDAHRKAMPGLFGPAGLDFSQLQAAPK